MRMRADGGSMMRAAEFNQRYQVGQTFILQPHSMLRGGRVVRTVDKARDLKNVTVVEINQEPYFANIKSLNACR